MEIKMEKTLVRGLLIAAMNLALFKQPVNVTDVKIADDGDFLLTVEIIPQKTEGGP